MRRLRAVPIGLLIVAWCADAAPAQTRDVRWQASIAMTAEQARHAQDAAALLAADFRALGAEAFTTGDQLEMEGGGTIEQLRTALFDGAAPWADLLGGPVDLTLDLPVGSAPLVLRLEARTTTGYRWDVVTETPGARAPLLAEPAFERRYRGPGAPSIQILQLDVSGSRSSIVRLRYHRRFDPDSPTRAWVTVRLADVSGPIDLSDPTPTPRTSPAIGEPATPHDPYAGLVPPAALPSSWDWRASGIVPTPRDQGGCGSCWAFGTVGVFESAIRKAGGAMTDLSEQFLISCNTDGWNCDGGWTANKYHHNTLGRRQTSVGGVLESAKPYTESNGSCTVAYDHPYRLDSWQFITGSEDTMPTVDQIKTAIYTYGPVTAGVCTDSGWDSYRGGVYTPRSNECDPGTRRGSTDHQIILVGWDDATSSWILRNSWGSSWGESGYMRIAWDTTGRTSRVGEGTSWVQYSGSSSTPPTITDPSSQTVTAGSTATFTVTVTGSPTPTVQWQGSASSGGSWTSLTNGSTYGGVTTTTLTVSNVTSGLNNYQYRAVATNSAGTATSNGATLRVTTAPPGAPGPPTGLTGSASGSTVTLSWTAPTTGGTPTSYTIEAGSGPGLANLAVLATGNTLTVYIAGGVGNGIFYVRVKATNATGASVASNEITVAVGGACIVPPGAPTGLTLVQNSGGTITLSWTGASGNPTTYFLEAGTTPGSANLANIDLGGTRTAFGASGVSPGLYWLRVRAGNACGRSGASNELLLWVQ